jgi:CHAD domain-containing protein
VTAPLASADPAGRVLQARLLRLLQALPAAQNGDVTSVHQARVASRRLREALPVAGGPDPGRDWRRARRQARRITRALGPVRELDVALETLDEFERRGGVAPAALNRVRQALLADRQERRRRMLEAITPMLLQKLRRRLGDVAARAAPADRAIALDEAARRVSVRAARLNEAIEHAGAVYLADRLHAVRIAAKKLRYAMELQRDLQRSRATARIRRLKAAQDELGRLHDLEVLIDRTRAVQADLAASSRRLAGELDRLVRALEDECRQIHATYLASRRALVAICAAVAGPSPDGRSSTAAA